MWRNGSELTERDKKEVLVLKPFWVVLVGERRSNFGW